MGNKADIFSVLGFPGGSSGEERACNAGDSGEPGLSLGWDDPLEEEMATHTSILAWRIPWKRNLAGYSPQGRTQLDTTEVT